MVSIPLVGMVKGLLGFTNIYDSVMSVLSCLCETVTMILSCLIYRRLKVVRGLKPLATHMSLMGSLHDPTGQFELGYVEDPRDSPVLHV